VGDHSTVDLISTIPRHRISAKLMLLGTYRPADPLLADHPLRTVKPDLLVRQLCTEIALEPLREAEIAEYLAADSSGAELPNGLSGLIHRHSEGNPLFMVAALAHLTKRGLISRRNGSWHVGSPLEEIDFEVLESLREMIEAQIERLKVEERPALELGSISGISFLANV
jgi:predicted ATPase